MTKQIWLGGRSSGHTNHVTCTVGGATVETTDLFIVTIGPQERDHGCRQYGARYCGWHDCRKRLAAAQSAVVPRVRRNDMEACSDWWTGHRHRQHPRLAIYLDADHYRRRWQARRTGRRSRKPPRLWPPDPTSWSNPQATGPTTRCHRPATTWYQLDPTWRSSVSRLSRAGGVTLASFTQSSDCITGQNMTAGGVGSYPQYRPLYLAIKRYGGQPHPRRNGTGTLKKLNVGSNAATFNINSGSVANT